MPRHAKSSSPSSNPPISTRAFFLGFSPRGGIQLALVSLIASAKRSIHVFAYVFSSRPIRDALIAAKARGVMVKVLMDRDSALTPFYAKYCVAPVLVAAGIPVYLDGKHPIFHDKIIVVDSSYLFTGSFNLTESAEDHNAENAVILQSSRLAQAYISNWDLHFAHSTPYTTPQTLRRQLPRKRGLRLSPATQR